MHASLPIDPYLPEITRSLRMEGAGVVVAPPGAGKTTAIPLALLRDAEAEGRKGRILLLEPRRLAARGAAWRMAELLGEQELGGTVGIRTRLETRVGPRTRIEVVTEGVLTRMLQSDPTLEGVSVLLLDEFHERSLQADLGLALALEARDLFRPELRILVLSATLDPAPVAALLARPGGVPAPIIRSEGRAFPVETRWRERSARISHPRGWIEPVVAATVREALAEEALGDVLVFLPGAAEIRRTAEALADLPAQIQLHTLHGALPRELQERALEPAQAGVRKVILASAVAETSLTVEGVRIVVDSGLMRVPRFDPGSGMARLETLRVSRDAADQRRGRAGRTAPGVCYRLWTPEEERGLLPTRAPEILESDLAPLWMELARWGAEAGALRWLTPPPEGPLMAARRTLQTLGILSTQGALTPEGEAVAELGGHPRVGYLLRQAEAAGVARLGCELAGLLADRDPIRSELGLADPDLRLRVEALRARGRGGADVLLPPGHRVDRGVLERAREEARIWARRLGVPWDAKGDSDDLSELGGLLAKAWPDRLGRLRERGSGYLLAGGRGAMLEANSGLAGSPWIVAVEVEDRGSDVRVRLAAPLSTEEVEEALAPRIEVEDRVGWNRESGRVEAFRVRKLGAIELGRAPLLEPPGEAVAAALAEGVRGRGLECLSWTPTARQLRGRLAFMRGVEGDLWPDTSDEGLLGGLESWLLPMAPGARSLADLGRVDLGEALLAALDWETRNRLDRWAPTHLQVPSGSRIALDYGDPEAPVLAARLQELFGMIETPRLAEGRVPVTVHLLSPARRPVQVTRDLASFWRTGYFEVRKDLKGRYPKHFWPDNPLEAPATHRVRPPSRG